MPDVNGTRHHLLLGWLDWSACQPPPGAQPRWFYDPAREAVTLAPLPFQFPQPRGDKPLTIEQRRGATRDRYGHWYWIGDDGQSIRVFWSAADHAEHYWSAMDTAACPPALEGSPFAPFMPTATPAPENLAGLAATNGHYLVVGSPDTGSLLIFDLNTGGTPIRLSLPPTPDGNLTRPYDLAPLADGGVVVLDREHRLLWVLDATFRVVPLPEALPPAPLLFQPETGQPRAEYVPGQPSPLELIDTADPVSVEPLPDGSFVVLDRADADFSTVRRYVPGVAGAVGSVALGEANLKAPPDPPLSENGSLEIVGHDLAYAGDLLYVTHVGGNQAFAFDLTDTDGLTLRLRRAFYPLRSHTGRALVASIDSQYAFFDQYDHWMPVVALPRPRYMVDALIDLPVLDGRDPGCVWHRLCLDACIPPETAIRVHTWAADELDLLDWLHRQSAPDAQPLPYQRATGAELPYYRLWSADELRYAVTGTWELLFQGVQGRYLKIRLELVGSGRETPVLRALRAHYPRFSYLKAYLPAVYQEDADSADFLDRFLANPEGLLTTLEGMIAAAQVFLDVRSVPPDARDWLAGWIGLAFDPALSDYQRRLLIAHAPYFYQRRGTLVGIIQAIRLILCPDDGAAIFQDQQTKTRVRVVESFRLRSTAALVLGDPTAEAPPTPPTAADLAHRFTVLLPSDVPLDTVELIRRVILVEKPAHTQFVIRQYWALFRVGEARLGVDTTLGEGGRFEVFRLGETALAEGRLGASYPFNLTDRTVLTR